MPASSCRLPLILIAGSVASSAACGDTICDAYSAGTDGEAFIGDLVLDDLTVDGGGVLTSITIALTATGGSGTVLTDVSLALALDGGDTFPDFDGTGDDSLFVQVERTDVPVSVGGVTEVTFGTADLFAVVPVDALLFGGAILSNPAVGHVFAGGPTAGSTSPVVFSFGAMGPVPAPSVTDPKLEHSDGLSFRLETIALPGPPPGGVITGSVIDFESLDEGFQGTSFTVDGVTFREGRDGFPPPIDGTFAIDDATGLWALYPEMLPFVSGKALNLNTFSSGPDGYIFALMKSMRITPDQPRRAARLSVAYVGELYDPPQSFADSTITLLALSDGEMVAATSILADNVLATSPGGTFGFGAGMIELAGVTFDELVLFMNGRGPFGGLQLGVDNVLIGDVACAGDLDGSGRIDFSDLVALLSAWGPRGAPACASDLDSDGTVGFNDLVVLLSAWGPCDA